MEAMACGLPVIASRIKGHEDLIEPGVNGLLFDFDDEEAFCQAVRQLYEDKKLREKWEGQGRKKVQRYRLEGSAGKYEKAVCRNVAGTGIMIGRAVGGKACCAVCWKGI